MYNTEKKKLIEDMNAQIALEKEKMNVLHKADLENRERMY